MRNEVDAGVTKCVITPCPTNAGRVHDYKVYEDKNKTCISSFIFLCFAAIHKKPRYSY